MKNNYKLISLIFIFFIFMKFLTAEEKRIVSILPFETVNTPKEEGKFISGLFEVALVKTEAFIVIEQSQIEKILDAQELSLNVCTEESCAVEIGKILSADNIFIGNVSLINKSYIITVKLVSVNKGIIVHAESIEVTSLENISKKIVTLVKNFTPGKDRNLNGSDKIEKLTEKIKELKFQQKKETSLRRKLNIIAWSATGLGIISAGLSGTFFYLSDKSYENYQNSIIPSEITQYRNEVQLYDNLKIGFGIGAIAGTTISIIFFTTGPHPKNIEKSIKEFESELKNLIREGE